MVRFNVALEGRNVDATSGAARVKPVQELGIVGRPLQRYDIPAKVDGSNTWAVDARVPDPSRTTVTPASGSSPLGPYTHPSSEPGP